MKALISASAVGYYGPHGDERLDEDSPPGDDFLADVCVAWEREAEQRRAAGLRVVLVRTGVLLDKNGGALEKMLLPFKLGAGGPVAGGDQYMPWIHIDDVVGIYVAAIDNDWSGPVNATAPEPVTNREFAKALGSALHRPAVLPTPGFAIKALYGDMAVIVTEGQRVVPRRTLELGYAFRHPELDAALRAAIVADQLEVARLLGASSPRPNAPICFHLDSGLAGTNTQMIAPRADRTRPDARPGFSP